MDAAEVRTGKPWEDLGRVSKNDGDGRRNYASKIKCRGYICIYYVGCLDLRRFRDKQNARKE